MAYSDITTNDPNFVKRWVQRRRISDAYSVFRFLNSPLEKLEILDFGAGDGQLAERIVNDPGIICRISVFEPSADLMMEAKSRLSRFENVNFVDRTSTVEEGRYDIIFCMEVFEHLPEKEKWDALKEIHRLLKPSGIAVIGVPHEIFLPALLKGVFRLARRRGAFDASLRNILLAMLGRPPRQRPFGEIAPGFFIILNTWDSISESLSQI